MWRYVILQWYTATRLLVPPLCYNSGHSSYSLIQTGGTSTTLPWLHDLHTVLWWLSFLLMKLIKLVSLLRMISFFLIFLMRSVHTVHSINAGMSYTMYFMPDFASPRVYLAMGLAVIRLVAVLPESVTRVTAVPLVLLWDIRGRYWHTAPPSSAHQSAPGHHASQVQPFHFQYKYQKPT
jgi:hypothetical protein